MNRKTFIQSLGATCANWNWSWSFVNTHKRFVIFGLWSHHSENDHGLILSKDWERQSSGRRNPGFRQSMRHIELIEKEGYLLFTFPMFVKLNTDGKPPENEPAKIDHIEPVLERKFLVELDGRWFAVDTQLPPARSFEPLISQVFEEGEQIISLSKHIERNPAARKQCLDHHGYQCMVCSQSMSDLYGPLGEGVIDVHHLHELSLRNGKHKVDPKNDLVPVCPNCHRIIHTQRPALSLEAVRKMLKKKL